MNWGKWSWHSLSFGHDCEAFLRKRFWGDGYLKVGRRRGAFAGRGTGTGMRGAATASSGELGEFSGAVHISGKRLLRSKASSTASLACLTYSAGCTHCRYLVMLASIMSCSSDTFSSKSGALVLKPLL